MLNAVVLVAWYLMITMRNPGELLSDCRVQSAIEAVKLVDADYIMECALFVVVSVAVAVAVVVESRE